MKPSKARGDPTIASLVVHNLKALTSLADTTKPANESILLAGSQLARFKLWSASLGAHRATGNRALEYRLRDASSIKNQVLSLLQDLSTVLDQARVGVHEQPDQLQDDLELSEIDAYFLRDDSPTQSPLDRSLADIGHILDCLLRLCVTISNPAPHDQFQSRGGAVVSAYYEPWDVRHVQEKFKDVDPIIAERLGRAITIRRQYFKYRKEHHDKLSEGLGNENDIGGDRTTIASSIPEHLKDTPGMTALLEDLDNKSEFSATSYAPSNAEPDQLRVPLIPAEHLEGPFLCPFCQIIIELETRRDWKKHVFRDLKPYICVEKSCSTPSRQYARRSEWINHMGHDHWRTWSCSFGCSGAFATHDTWHKHTRAAHSQDISGMGLELLEAGSVYKNLGKATGNCPLCVTEKIKDSRHYSHHIGHHLESLALFSLPKIEGNDDVDERVVGESDPRPEDQATHQDDSSVSDGDPSHLLETLRRLGERLESLADAKGFQEVMPQSSPGPAQYDPEMLEMQNKIDGFKNLVEEIRAAKKANKEIEEARQAVEKAARDSIEKEGQATEEQDQANVENLIKETEVATAVEAAAEAKLIEAIRAKEKAEAAAQKKMDEEAEYRKLLEEEAKLKAEIEAREKRRLD